MPYSKMSVDQIGEDLKQVIGRLERYVRLEVTDRLTVMGTYATVVSIVLALMVPALLLIGIGAAKGLAVLIGSEALSFCLVGLALILVALLCYLMRGQWIEKPIMNALVSQILNAPGIASRLNEESAKEDEQIRELARSLVSEMDDYDEEGGAV